MVSFYHPLVVLDVHFANSLSYKEQEDKKLFKDRSFMVTLLKFFLTQIWYLVTPTMKFAGLEYYVMICGEKSGVWGWVQSLIQLCRANSDNSLGSAPQAQPSKRGGQPSVQTHVPVIQHRTTGPSVLKRKNSLRLRDTYHVSDLHWEKQYLGHMDSSHSSA